MAKVADVKLTWTKSATADVSKVVLSLNNNGTTTTTELGPEVEEFVIVVNALSSVQFSLTVFDGEGLQAMSSVYSFILGDLENPLPPTNLGHEVLAIRDV